MSEEQKKRTSEPRASKNTAESEAKPKTTRKKTENGSTGAPNETKKTSRSTGSAKKQEAPKLEEPVKEEKKEPNPSSAGNQLAMVLLVVSSVFIGICYAFRDDVGVLGHAIGDVFFGLFGIGAFLVPFLLLQMALFWRRDVLSGAVKYKYIVALFLLVFSSAMLHTIWCIAADVPKVTIQTAFSLENIKNFYLNGVDYQGGGFFGGLLASAFICAVGYPGAILFGILFLVGFGLSLFGLTPMECFQRYRFYRLRGKSLKKVRDEEREKRREEAEKAREEASRAEFANAKTQKNGTKPRKNAPFGAQNGAKAARETVKSDERIDSDIFDDDVSFGGGGKAPAAEVQRPISDETLTEAAPHPKKEKEKTTLGKVFAEEKKEDKVPLTQIFDKREDEAVLSRYAADPEEQEEESLTVAQMELALSQDEPAVGTLYVPAETIDPEADVPYFPSRKPRTEEKTEVRSAPTAPATPAYARGRGTAEEGQASPQNKQPASEMKEGILMGARTPTPVTERIQVVPKPETPIAAQTPAKAPAKQEAAAHPVNRGMASDVIAIRPPEMSVPAPATEADEDEDELFEVPKPREYELPPIDLLSLPPEKKEGDVSAELRENADRIIQTLDSFNVRVNISNVSRGPTITRYEVEPAPGTRVRSIINLLDDIALSLATSGVRSDGIISGKSAIGIEVPNKKTNTVYVRELIEDSRFESAKSKLTASLGMDVSGAPVYLDIAKMPHLLIAGATGQGKSVCINSLIISLLYKARPDEVKLILIDPKKVELNVYNGLPHLLVPVVFDPKKAAGSLHWAVQEMERRFELIEAQKVRNIAQYNAAIAGDPTKEQMPQVVIIIDELADLMMSAPDDVETSICRLAQKARAAGMHLIIGTQRPSTDVITGLIKANIPSRIAFTVSNQIDSRIIIDTQGAEKLIGKGDMLFSPVGSSKPIRVQGSFVSESEIENIIDFIKDQSAEATYSDEIMKEIEKNAAVCGQKKKGGAAASSVEADLSDGEEADPMLDAAIELAVDSGKISTSLIQRRLSLGYGRAAKLIDVMEKRGIVSPPEGQKPRTVLLTREMYLEMRMNQDGGDTQTDDTPPFDL